MVVLAVVAFTIMGASRLKMRAVHPDVDINVIPIKVSPSWAWFITDSCSM